MFNVHLFELMNASPGLAPGTRVLAVLLAEWAVWLLPLAWCLGWWRGNHASRHELLQMLTAVLVALLLSEIWSHAWPQPRPSMLHLGQQYLQDDTGAGLPCDQVTVFWALACAALFTRRYAVWAFPLMALGLIVGWSRVFVGIHFPFDVLAAAPVAAAGAIVARGLRRPLLPVVAQVLYLYALLERAIRVRLHLTPKP